MENSDNLGSCTLQGCKAARLQGCKARFLKSTNFTLSSLVLTLFISSNMAYADGANSYSAGGGSATGEGSIATGSFSQASGEGSTATGSGAHAIGENSVALGVDSMASHENEVNIGIWKQQDDNSYKQTGTRTLSGLAEATHDDEAVNKGQLDTGINSLDTKAQGYASTAQANAVTHSKAYTDESSARTL
ncbi:hypothetical protein AB6Q20_002298 [Salmonella enterica]|nr:hypothetical protein [Salmonella enterica]